MFLTRARERVRGQFFVFFSRRSSFRLGRERYTKVMKSSTVDQGQRKDREQVKEVGRGGHDRGRNPRSVRSTAVCTAASAIEPCFRLCTDGVSRGQ
jgi:hypothetical protein